MCTRCRMILALHMLMLFLHRLSTNRVCILNFFKIWSGQISGPKGNYFDQNFWLSMFYIEVCVYTCTIHTKLWNLTKRPSLHVNIRLHRLSLWAYTRWLWIPFRPDLRMQLRILASKKFSDLYISPQQSWIPWSHAGDPPKSPWQLREKQGWFKINFIDYPAGVAWW